MKKEGYFSSGEFAKMAHVSVRTIRFYDQKKLLSPSYVTESGARFYTKYDFVRLQQILLLKYLGFSLDDIREMSLGQSDLYLLTNTLGIQKKLIQERIDELCAVRDAIDTTINTISKNDFSDKNRENPTDKLSSPSDSRMVSSSQPDWSSLMELIHLTAIENSLKKQYQNATNISSRIRLHEQYSANKQGWFPWVLEQCELRSDMKILELGCGNGELWIDAGKSGQLRNIDNLNLTLSDISEGILRDARRSLEQFPETERHRLRYLTIDCHSIPFPDNSFDLIIANHVLFYCENIPEVCSEIRRVLKPDGRFICSTYSSHHMKEISRLVENFDDRIRLSAEHLYERFGFENGKEYLSRSFDNVAWKGYEDEIILTTVDPLIEYILSCHGNQNQYLLDRYAEFHSYLDKIVGTEFHITKDAGLFICGK